MTAPKLLETEPGTPPPLRSLGGRGLPDDLLREAVQRLGIVCIVGAVLWTIGVFQMYVVAPRLVPPDRLALLDEWRSSPVPIPSSLEQVVLACLAKNPADRPTNARDLADRLARCQLDARWTRDDARQWWESRLAPAQPVTLGQPATISPTFSR